MRPCGFFASPRYYWAALALGAAVASSALAANSKPNKIECPALFSQLDLGGLTPLENKLLAKAGFRKLKMKYGNGKGLHFSSPFFYDDSTTQSAIYRQNLYKGESRAAQFVKRFLLELFPEATFSESEGAIGRRTLPIVIKDLGEHSNEKDIVNSMKKFNSIPMHVIKPAMGPSNAPKRLVARKNLGLGQDAKVVSLYICSPGTVADIGSRQAYPQSQLDKLIPAVLDSTKADAVILSFGNMDGSVADSQIFATPLGRWKRVEVLNGAKRLMPTAEKTLIINSTTGRMGEMHSAADLAIVVGPVNFFEPISLGVPTLIYRNAGVMSRQSMLRGYSQTIYDQQIALAMESGIARVANNPSEIAQGVNSLQAIREPSKSITELALPNFLRTLRGYLERTDRVTEP